MSPQLKLELLIVVCKIYFAAITEEVIPENSFSIRVAPGTSAKEHSRLHLDTRYRLVKEGFEDV